MVRACSARMRSDTSCGVGPAEPAAGDRLRRLDERHHHVDVPHRVLALQHAEDALEPGAGVDVLAGQVVVDAVAVAVVLHEHEVPDLEEPVVAAVGRTAALAVRARPGRRRSRSSARTGPGGPPGGPHQLSRQALDALGRHAGRVDPELLGLVVVGVDGDPQLVGVDAEQVGDHVPGHGDGLGLEVVAEAEVAEHLEEAQVAGVAARPPRGRCPCRRPARTSARWWRWGRAAAPRRGSRA